MDITIVRTHGGHWEGTNYISNTEIIPVKGILVSPKNSKEIQPTEQGDQATGFVGSRVDLEGIGCRGLAEISLAGKAG